MTTNEITQTVKRIIQEVLPELPPNEIDIRKSLKDLGANSIDRMEVVTLSMETLRIKVPMTEFAHVSNIQELIDVLSSKVFA